MAAEDFAKEIIYMFEDIYGIDFFVEEEIEDFEVLSEYEFDTELIINPAVYEELPIDVTNLVLSHCEVEGIDPDDFINSLSIVRIEPLDVGIKDRFDLISLSFGVNIEDDTYQLTNITLL